MHPFMGQDAAPRRSVHSTTIRAIKLSRREAIALVGAGAGGGLASLFDRVTIPIVPDAQKVATILALLEAGYADQLLLSSDFSNRLALKKDGGPGVAQTVTVFGPMLLKAGVSETTLRRILVDNSRRFLAFVPKAA
jgi:hypothetical protein